MTASNVELKAQDLDRERSLEVCRALRAEDHGEIWQRDTYFRVPSGFGALKLREERPGRPHLIQYQRANEPQARESRYRIASVDDADDLSCVLTAALGCIASVTKRRRLFLWRGVRIHLDEVEGLGSFLELEAVAERGSDLVRERQLVHELRDAFAVTDDQLVADGYLAQVVTASSAGGA